LLSLHLTINDQRLFYSRVSKKGVGRW